MENAQVQTPHIDLAQLQAMLLLDSQTNEPALQEYKKAKRYYHGHQLETPEIQKLQARGQTPIWENMFKMICDKILGYKLQSSTEIKVSGRQEEDKALANVLTDLLRVFNQQANYENEIYKRDFELLMGMSAVELWVQQDDDGDKHITLKSLDTDSFLIDAYSTDKNAQDATRFHKKINMDLTAAQILLGTREIYASKADLAAHRCYIIESWIKEYDSEQKCGYSWNRYLWHDTFGIYKFEKMPFLNNTHPFVIAKYNIDEKQNWYGLFRDIAPNQDYINFAENKIANMISTQKMLYETSAVDNPDFFSQEVQKDNAVVQVRDGALKDKKIEFVQHHADIQALGARAEAKKTMMKILSGLNDEALAMATNRQSGVAITQRREAGLLGLQYYVNSADNADRLMYEKVLSFMEHYFTKEQVFRITDKKRGERYFKINTDAQNTLKIGKFDLVYKTQLKQQGAEERFAHWSEIMKTIQATQPQIVPLLLPLILKDVDSQIADDVADVLAQAEQQAQEQAKQAAPIQQKMQDMQMQKMAGEAAEAQSRANKYNAQADIINMQTDVLQEQLEAGNAEAMKINNSARGLQIPGGNLAGVKDMIYDSVRK